jgi:hypothetical protein
VKSDDGIEEAADLAILSVSLSLDPASAGPFPFDPKVLASAEQQETSIPARRLLTDPIQSSDPT